MNENEVFICKNCGTKLQEIDGKERCYICGGDRESLTLYQIRTQMERAKKWIYYGAYDEAKKELSVLEQYQVSGSSIYLLRLMMDMEVATQEELRILSKDFQDNINFQQIQKCSGEHPEDYTGGLIAEYAQKAAQNYQEKVEKEERQIRIGSYVVVAFLTLVFYLTLSGYPGSGLLTRFWIVWILTLGILYGRKKILEKFRKFAYIGLVIVWVVFYLFWANVLAQYENQGVNNGYYQYYQDDEDYQYYQDDEDYQDDEYYQED